MAEKTIGDQIAAKKREIKRHTKELQLLEDALNGAPTYKAGQLWWMELERIDLAEIGDHTDEPTFAMLVGVVDTVKADLKEMQADKLAFAYYTPYSHAGNGLVYPGVTRLVLTTNNRAIAKKWKMEDANGELVAAFDFPTKTKARKPK